MGAASLHKSMGAASQLKSVGATSLHKSMGAASQLKSVGATSLQKSMGAASLHKSMGAASLHKSMSAASLHKSMGVASLHKSMGAASLHKSMGAVSLHRSMGDASLCNAMSQQLESIALRRRNARRMQCESGLLTARKQGFHGRGRGFNRRGRNFRVHLICFIDSRLQWKYSKEPLCTTSGFQTAEASTPQTRQTGSASLRPAEEPSARGLQTHARDHVTASSQRMRVDNRDFQQVLHRAVRACVCVCVRVQTVRTCAPGLVGLPCTTHTFVLYFDWKSWSSG